MIATLVVFGASTPLPRLAVLLAWGSVAGSALQFAVQLPAVLRVAPDLRFALDRASGARPARSCANFVPVFISRGVVQISAYIDTLLASLLPTGAVTGLANAQLLYTLPVSLFGMSVAAAELPAMAGAARSDASGARRAARAARRRPAADRVLRRAVGDGVPGARRRRSPPRCCRPGDSATRTRVYVWGILAGSARRAAARPRSAACTRRPTTRCAIRGRRCATRSSAVALTTVLGYVLARFRSRGGSVVPRALGRGRPDASGGRRPAGSRCCCCAAR